MKKFIVLAAVSILLFGAGCRWPFKKTPPATPAEPAAYLPPPAPPEDENVRNLRELRQALEAFRKVKSFKAKITLSGDDGTTSGQIEVMKPDRFKGSITASGDMQTSEIIGVGDTLYVKMADGTWSGISSPAVSKQLTQAFRAAVDGDQSAVKQPLPDGTQVTRSQDTRRSCQLYSATITDTAGKKVTMGSCLDKGLPSSIELIGETGTVTLEYYDYNKVFVIERPTVKR